MAASRSSRGFIFSFSQSATVDCATPSRSASSPCWSSSSSRRFLILGPRAMSSEIGHSELQVKRLESDDPKNRSTRIVKAVPNHVPRRGPAYPTTPEWKQAVREAIDEKGLDLKRFARKLRCAQSSLSEALADNGIQSSLVPVIHKALGWPPPPLPQPPPNDPIPIATPDAVELAAMFDRLPEELRQKLKSDAEMYTRLVGGPPKSEN